MARVITGADRWARVGEVFAGALEREGDARERYLGDACGSDAELRAELQGLLDAHERATEFDRLAERVAADVEAALPPSLDHGSYIGPWRVLSTIGAGGMGDVFLGERDGDGFHQRVAIKVLRARGTDEALHQRFRAERSILARLEHPNIPRFLDGGLTVDGAPWFAMEFVEGIPIDRYCDAHGLSTRERLALFASVCDAMQYAHQHLVVHRDLKPSNILVTAAGVVKVLDFGIAKILDTDHPDTAVTGAGQRWMTTDYASPEQVRGEPTTTAADVFALGVVLYELLVGRRPHIGASRHEVERAILEGDPARPSDAVSDVAYRGRGRNPDRVRRDLVGDLDTITLKALAKDPERRYRAAGELGDDIRRHLGGLPVEARSDSFGYRTRKFVARHRWLVASVSFAALSVLAGVVIAMDAATRGHRMAREAALERDRAEEVSRFVVSVFTAADPTVGGRDVTARALLDSGFARLRRDLPQQHARRAAMFSVLAQSYFGLGQLRETRAAAEEAVAARRLALPPDSAALADALTYLASIALHMQETDSAAALAREVLAIGDAARPVTRGRAMSVLGDWFHTRGAVDSAEHFHRSARDLIVASPADTAAWIESTTNLAYLEAQLGRLAQAESLHLEVLTLTRSAFHPAHPGVADVLADIAMTRVWAKRYPEARAALREGLDIRVRALGPRHPDVARTMHQMGYTAYQAQDFDSAAYWFDRAARLRVEILGPTDMNYALDLSRLGVTRGRQGRRDESERLQRRALAVFQAAGTPASHPDVVVARLDLAAALIARDARTEAARLLEETRAILLPAGQSRRLAQVDSLLTIARSRQ